MITNPFPSDTLYPYYDVFPGLAVAPPSSRPVVSDAANELYSHLTQIADGDGDNGWVLLWLCEAMTAHSMDPLLKLLRDSDAGPGWSALMDLNRTPSYALPWLAQFVGATIPADSTPDQMRDIILNRPSTARGRPATLIAAVQQTLTGAQSCILTERDSSPYHATLQVKTAECPNPTATRAAIAANKPGMIIVELDILSGPTYGHILADIAADPTYRGREAMFPTYGDILGG